MSTRKRLANQDELLAMAEKHVAALVKEVTFLKAENARLRREVFTTASELVGVQTTLRQFLTEHPELFDGGWSSSNESE